MSCYAQRRPAFSTRDSRERSRGSSSVARKRWVNETHGHAVGDEALKLVARTLAAEVRSYDLVARYGERSSPCSWREASAPQARIMAERCRALRRERGGGPAEPYATAALASRSRGPLLLPAEVGVLHVLADHLADGRAQLEGHGARGPRNHDRGGQSYSRMTSSSGCSAPARSRTSRYSPIRAMDVSVDETCMTRRKSQ